jgi:general L-amino acid transport system permease protein
MTLGQIALAASRPPTHIPRATGQIPLWRDERVLRGTAQAASAIVVLFILYLGLSNVLTAASQRGLSLGFGFLDQSAGFPIAETPIPYTPSDTFRTAFVAGVLNTLKVAGLGVVLATILGTLVGLARLSSNWLVNRLALVYIEAHRNIPLLVLLFLWYRGVWTTQLPGVKDAVRWPGPTYLTQRGVFMVWPHLTPSGTPFAVMLGLGIVSALAAWFILRRIRERTGRATYFGGVSAGLLILLPLVGWFISGGQPLAWEAPQLQTFNFVGGVHLTPEFVALLVSLVMYTAAFIAEVVRAGIQAVDQGQTEAARALGLSAAHVLGLVILPQALRVIIPPLISQYLNLTKNSSLAFFIGFPEVFTVSRIMINQAGRAVPVFLMMMGAYLAMSLLTSFILNIYNHRIQLVER